MAKPKFTREELIGLLQDFNDKYGHAPVENDFRSGNVHPKMKTPYTIVRVFGSYAAALQSAGLALYKGNYKGHVGRKRLTQEEREKRAKQRRITQKAWKIEALSRWEEAKASRIT